MRRWRSPSLGTPGRAGVAYRLVFNPQVLIGVAAVGLTIFGAREVVGSAVYLWWGSTYRQVDFVMTEASPNDGVPIIRGRLEPGDEGAVLEATLRDGVFAVLVAPAQTFTPGHRFRVWWSPSAPVVGFGPGLNTQFMPVTALPRLPGPLRLLKGLALVAAPLLGGLVVLNVLSRLGVRTRVYEGQRLLDRDPGGPGS